MKIVGISDVHCKWNKLTIPECDILISAGDFSFKGEKHVVEDYHKWLNKQPAKHIISVMGNHEVFVENNFNECKELVKRVCPKAHFIEEGLIELEDLKIWCSAWTPFFFNWAYNAHRGEEIQKHWNLIPNEIDILVTHSPPFGILDATYEGDHIGCEDLLKKIKEIKLDLHLFGHNHFQGGKQVHKNGVSYYNLAVCDERYIPINGITVIDYEKENK